jgi:peptidoglycan/xylan/chitin deacetylase (PgdA/CDA1 family)
MSIKKNILLSFSVFFLIMPCFAQVPGRICNWDDDKKAAVVLTFDDWSPAHYYLVTPELQSRNINATFFIPTNAVSSWSKVQTVANYGNEVANHSKSHPDLTTLTPAQQKVEIRDAKTLIDQNVTGRTTTTYAYPYGAFNNAVIDSVINSGHIASRGVWPASGNYTYNFATSNADYYNILTYGMNGTVTTNDFYTQVKNVMDGGGLLTYLFHCVVNSSYPASSCGTGAVDLPVFQKQLDTLIYVKDQVWITTFEKSIKYHREKRSATLSEIQVPNGVQWVLDLTDTLSNNNLYNLPLTIKLKMNGVNYDQILQNGNSVSIDAIQNDTIMFHAVPDGGQIVLKVSTGIVISSATVTPSVVSNNTSNNLSFAVTATDDGSISNVAIDLSPIGGTAVTMTSAGGNNYTLSYNLPAGTSTGAKTFIVTAADNSGNTNTSTIPITITSGTVISGSVSPSAVLNNVSTALDFSITATDDGAVSSVNIDLSSIGGSSAVGMDAAGGNSYTLSYTVPKGTVLGNKNIIVSVIDDMGNVTTKTIVLTVNPYLTYLNIYTDNNSMITGTWSSGTLTEQSNAGAIEGIKDYLFSYNVNGWVGLGLNISNWTSAQAKNFSGYDSLQLSYLGPIGPGNASISLRDPSVSSGSVTLPSVSSYTTISIPLSSFTGADLSKITELNISFASGSATFRIDNIRLVKVCPVAVAGINQSVCASDQVNLDATVTNASSVSWTTGGTGTFSNNTLEDPVYTPSASDISAGTVTLTLMASESGCTNSSDQMEININTCTINCPIVDAGIDQSVCANDQVNLASTVTDATSLSWTTGGTGNFTNNTLEDPIYTPSASDISTGTVTLTLTASKSGCTNSSDQMEININTCTGISSSQSADNMIMIYPNPATNYTEIKLSEGLMINEISIYNILGEKVKLFTVSGNKISLPIDDLNKGIYYLFLTEKSGTQYSRRIIKQ